MNVIFNYIAKPVNHVANLIYLIVKQYIYKKRCLGQRLLDEKLIRSIHNVQNMEKYIAIKND